MNAIQTLYAETPSQRRDRGPAPATEEIDTCRTTGYELYKAGNYLQAELVCRGLVDTDPTDWYHHCLLAATLQKMGRFAEAIAQLDWGLHLLPNHFRLLALRNAIARSAERTAVRMRAAARVIGRRA